MKHDIDIWILIWDGRVTSQWTRKKGEYLIISSACCEIYIHRASSIICQKKWWVGLIFKLWIDKWNIDLCNDVCWGMTDDIRTTEGCTITTTRWERDHWGDLLSILVLYKETQESAHCWTFSVSVTATFYPEAVEIIQFHIPQPQAAQFFCSNLLDRKILYIFLLITNGIDMGESMGEKLEW